ncbi:MAG TPA: ABC transporter ATP-binding protein [Petrotogaceae bacterium]|nr:ABC transporter ATP-binding protein [Petrotogaceae bacterium]
MLKLFKNLKPYSLSVILVFTLIFVQVMAELYLPNLMSDIVDKGIAKGDTSYIFKTGAFMLIVAAIGVGGMIAASFLSSRIATGFGRDVRKKLFTHIENFSLNEFDRLSAASLITRTTNDITQVQMVLIVMMRMMAMAPMMCIGGIIMAVSKDPKLSLIIVFAIPIVVGAILLVARKGISLFKAMQKKIDKLNLILREELIGIRVIRAFNKQFDEQERFNSSNKELTQTAIRVNQIMAFLMPFMMVIMNFITLAVIWFGAKRIDAMSMQVGDLMAFIQYIMHIMFSLIMVSMMFILIPRASVSAARINEVLETSPEITDPLGNKKEIGLQNQRGTIEFRNVSFSYQGAAEPAIKDISFVANQGETTAIIGGTGSGKSTIVNLILRFYDVSGGNIFVNGIDVKDYTQKELRDKIGLVPQNTMLFSGSISDNIRYGNPSATDEEVAYAAKIAQADEFINSMPQKYDSQISQGGTNISGGQKQRLSIARALVRKPEIYIFDDSFSALDFKTDAKLRKELALETANSTVIIVSQRVSTVMNAEQIIVLEDGKIAGKGTHKALMENCPQYREIVASQLSEEELK